MFLFSYFGKMFLTRARSSESIRKRDWLSIVQPCWMMKKERMTSYSNSQNAQPSFPGLFLRRGCLPSGQPVHGGKVLRALPK